MKNLTRLVLFLVACGRLLAADRYVDSDVVSNGDGASWATAWKQLTNINWAVISAGDTIWLSGGDYYGVVSFNKVGTAEAPIRLKKSQEEGHTDLATHHGRFNGGFENVWIDGAKDDSFTNQITSTYGVTNITNNIGFKIDSSSVSNRAINIFGNGPNGFRLLWMEITTGVVFPPSAAGNAVEINAGDITNSEIAYCWIHDAIANGINMRQDDHWIEDSIIVHHNLIERIGDDGVSVNGGGVIHHNIIRDTLEIVGHPDGIVGLGHNLKIYNNIIYDWNTEPLYINIADEVHTNFFVYGNLIYSEDLEEIQEAAALIGTEGAFPYMPGGVVTTTNAAWGNVSFFNNSFIAGRWVSEPFNLVNRYAPEFQGTNPGVIVTYTNWHIANNIFYGGDTFAANFKGGAGIGIVYTTNTLRVETNIFYSDAVLGNRIRYGQEDYFDDVAAFQAATGFIGNTNGEPLFQDFEARDFRLSTADTVARGKGLNLAATGLPGIEYDIYGNYRGDGAWDIGAIAISEVEATLLLHLTFEDDFPSLGYSADVSGNSAHMLRFGFAGGTTNFPTILTPGKIGQSAAFIPYYDSHPYTSAEFNDGQYGAITNTVGLTNLTNATFALWAKYDPVSIANPDDRTLNHNASFLSAGYSTHGAWHFSRHYSTTFGQPQFNIQTNTAGGGDAMWRNSWPTGPTGYWYTNSVWVHLAATIDCSVSTSIVVRLYTDGVPVLTNTLELAEASKIPYLAIHNPTGASTPPWIAVGALTHNGPHYLETDAVPNNGWLNGSLDDVRIYNQVLTTAEIAAIVAEAPAAEATGLRNITIGRGHGKARRPR